MCAGRGEGSANRQPPLPPHQQYMGLWGCTALPSLPMPTASLSSTPPAWKPKVSSSIQVPHAANSLPCLLSHAAICLPRSSYFTSKCTAKVAEMIASKKKLVFILSCFVCNNSLRCPPTIFNSFLSSNDRFAPLWTYPACISVHGCSVCAVTSSPRANTACSRTSPQSVSQHQQSTVPW